MNAGDIARIRERLARAAAAGSLPALRPEEGTRAALAPGPAGRRDARFIAALEALTGTVRRVGSDPAAIDAIATRLAEVRARRIAAWDEPAIGVAGLYDALRERGFEVVPANLPLAGEAREASLRNLADCDAGLTGAEYGCAATGSLVLVHGPGRGRVASLLPPRHVAVLRADRLRDSLEAVIAEAPGLLESAANIVAVTGPSRTADIEMTLTRGVHGPRYVDVILVGGD